MRVGAAALGAAALLLLGSLAAHAASPGQELAADTKEEEEVVGACAAAGCGGRPDPERVPIDTIVSLLQKTSSKPARRAAGPATIGLYQWNPHYECFAGDSACSHPALEQMTSDLAQGVDFANIIELENHDDFEVSGFVRSQFACEGVHGDQISMFYDSQKWKPLSAQPTQGCAPGNTRAFQVWAFSSVADSSFKVVVAGAHFDHANPGSLPGVSIDAVGNAIGAVGQGAGTDKLIFLGDTNVYYDGATGAGKTQYILDALLTKAGSPFGPDAKVVGTDLATSTCCYNQGGQSSYPANEPFDRIFANFGASMTTAVLDSPNPAWSQFSKFHRAVKGTLTL